jgi:diguanylate cyclase (GGDEF)-like protein
LSKQKHKLTAIVALASVYFAAGKLGLTMAFVHPSATAVWPPSGIALAAFLFIGYEIWPGVWLGAFVLNLATMGSVPVCVGIATGNTLEGLLAAYLVNRFADGRSAMCRAQDIFKFAILSLLSTMPAATLGVSSLTLGGYANRVDFWPIWRTWWLGDAVGVVLVAPLLILWILNPHLQWRWAQFGEAVVLLVSLILASLIVFNGLFISGAGNYPLEYLCIPFVVWAGYRFGQREAAAAMLAMSGIAIWGTFHGFGPFARASRNESLLFLQMFLGIIAVVTTAFATALSERQHAELHAQFLATSDELTGLGNYRKLFENLQTEIRRSDRSERSFAFLLLDLDGLKKINDTYGHLVGDRALCRLADVLRAHCRNIDTAARYGGDEFALIIPEAGAEGARQVAQRISERLVNDDELPLLSVSIGAAVFPYDGKSTTSLFQAADRALYCVKRQAVPLRYISQTSEPN